MTGKEKRGQPVWAAGAMSCATLGCVDVGVLRTDGVEILDFGEVRRVPYGVDDLAILRAAAGAWPGEAGVAAATKVVEAAHTVAMVDLPPVEVVGFHGHTLAHDPSGGRTHQAGDGATLAEALGTEVIWDFRSADMGMGGQGARLSAFFYWTFARWLGLQGPVAFVDLGVVGRMVWIDPRVERPEDPGACLAFDTGPALDVLDALLAGRGLDTRDHGAAVAAQGEIDLDVLEAALTGAWFEARPPKSLEEGAFSEVLAAVEGLNDADAAATVTALCAGAVARGMMQVPGGACQVLVTGEGRKNAALMAMLEEALGLGVQSVDTVGLNSDAFEALAFAYLAVRVGRGLPTSAPSTTGVAAPVGGGRRSTPGAARLR